MALKEQARLSATLEEVLHANASARNRSWPTGPLASDPSKLQERNRLSESAAVRIGEGAKVIHDGFHVLNCAAAVIAALRDSQQEIPSSKTRKV